MWRSGSKKVRLAANECEYQEQDRQVREQFICSSNDEHMHSKIISEIKARSKPDKFTSEQVLMWQCKRNPIEHRCEKQGRQAHADTVDPSTCPEDVQHLA